jgi:BlaI family transcriptional regulator, penicillinase repressor
MKPDKIKISQSEWDIMEVIWEQSPLSASEIFERLESKTDWNVKTVRSFLDRLVQKQAVKKGKIHGINVFEPIPKRQQCLRKESRSFLDRFFQGNPASMISHFIEHEGLSEEDVSKLQHLLDSKIPTDKK